MAQAIPGYVDRMMVNPPLSVSGAEILDASGYPVRLAGVNWSGAHQNGLVPAGLDKLHRSEIISRIAAWGLNHVRLTFALGTFVTDNGTLKTGPAPDQWRLAANPDLQGLSPWQVYQQIVTDLVNAGIAVIPNCHLLFQGQCCSDTDANGLWYNSNWPASTFAATWTLIATQFASEPLVIGYDLKNEPRPATFGGATWNPSWGDGSTDTDFRLMYSDTASRIRAASGGNPKLFFCEGLSYASDLTKAGTQPITGGDIVYSLHDYSWFHPQGMSQSDYNAAMDARGGYLMTEGTAPVWIGEFGTNTDVHDGMTSGWMPLFLSWASTRGVHWCWWQLSAETVLSIEPATNALKAPDGDRETYGLMSGDDWRGSQARALAALAPIM